MSVVDFRCGSSFHDGREVPYPTHSIVFVRRGVFRRAAGNDWLVADPNQVLFFNAAQPYRYEHPLPGGDDCTILTLQTSRALELVTAHAPRDAERPEAPFPLGHALGSGRVARLHYELLLLLRHGAPRLAVEDTLAELADGSLSAAYGRKDLAAGGAAARRQHDLVEAAKLELNRCIASPPSLGQMADALDCSPFHHSRILSHSEGLRLRSYLGRLRARLAAERLLQGTRDLTELALDLGYSDHSHFTNAFRRAWG
ncbi:MAG TPA: helix-turn-helix transcriptional regulator, partial [Thermoanaerobaculia bacterium]|nr:helix-turn-helix transcriptional regulator [Thermoanaerobaculia bacterium]